jgi:NTP pyrophosphatase (non-canonical NTP hydrolase)
MYGGVCGCCLSPSLMKSCDLFLQSRKTIMNEIIDALKTFRDERDWQQFHNPKDLSMALSIEAAELLEAFLWKQPGDADLSKIKEELADVFAYAFLLADACQLDVRDIVMAKIRVNEQKYPVEKSRGSAKKHNEL